MTTIKTNSSHLVSTCVSGTGLCTLHTNPMKYGDRLRFMRRKLRQGEVEDVASGCTACRVTSVNLSTRGVGLHREIGVGAVFLW